MRNFLTIISLCMLVVSCDIGDKIYVGEPEDVEFRGIENNNINVIAQLPITNNNGFRVKLKAVDLEARVDGKYLGKVHLKDEVIVKGHTNQTHEIPLQLEIKNIVLGATTIFRLSQNRKKPMLSLEGEIITTGLLMRKKIPIKEDDLLRYMN